MKEQEGLEDGYNNALARLYKLRKDERLFLEETLMSLGFSIENARAYADDFYDANKTDAIYSKHLTEVGNEN